MVRLPGCLLETTPSDFRLKSKTATFSKCSRSSLMWTRLGRQARKTKATLLPTTRYRARRRMATERCGKRMASSAPPIKASAPFGAQAVAVGSSLLDDEGGGLRDRKRRLVLHNVMRRHIAGEHLGEDVLGHIARHFGLAVGILGHLAVILNARVIA